ncbi:MAG TPA: Arm DNA-binding domain-containing protein [Verrucomicrobiae bacterium]|nr:Arm DNA-binding domain-containing protein [Verrucomicrobiae bacterium]
MVGGPVAPADGGGLTFTLSAKGTAAWGVRYGFGGQPREPTIGHYPEITLTKARELAMELVPRSGRGRTCLATIEGPASSARQPRASVCWRPVTWIGPVVLQWPSPFPRLNDPDRHPL